MDTETILKSYFSKQKEVLGVYLFGSVAKGKENRFSDVDVAVLFDRSVPEAEYTDQQLAFMNGLSRLLNRDVDVVVLNKATVFLRFQILRGDKRVYERPDRNERTFEARTLVEYLDFLPIRRRLEASLIRSIRGS